ncbi:uncharacterized protein LOC143295266 [Babylonia areolata]|uniref:uncharacterized protein LOC143295266 n=1 Tax=Babylonia areolata TaxID=304850 RepID=UPI003FD0FCD0
MFRSCGFFASIPCQYYINGLCERPYCHFRHSKHDVEKLSKENAVGTLGGCDLDSTASDSGLRVTDGSALSNTTSSQEPSQTSDSEPAEKASLLSPGSSHENTAGSFCIPSFTDNRSKYQVPIAEEPEQYHTSLECASNEASSPYPESDVGGSALPTYLPTPKTPSLPVPEPVTDDLGIPVYQPTPKRELKRRHEDHVQTKKAKSADLEYDPECNFSCGGLIGRSQDKCNKDCGSLDYKPTEKKARISGSFNKRTRLSCESLTGSSPNGIDEDLPEGQFSDQEEDFNNENTQSVEEVMKEEETITVDNKSNSFENIGDDDISSEDDFIDVPSVTVSESDLKQRKHSSPKSVDKKSAISRSCSDKDKISSNKKEVNKHVSGKTGSGENKKGEKLASKHVSSKSSSHGQLSKSSSREKLEKTGKPSSSSSQKKAGQSSSGGSRMSSSASAKHHFTEKSHSTEKATHSSKQSSQLKTSDGHTRSKTNAPKSNHTDRPSSSKSLSKTSSCDKLLISSKHSSPSLSKPVLQSCSARKSSTDSLDSKISKDVRSTSDRDIVGMSRDSDDRRSSSEGKISKLISSKSLSREQNHKTNRTDSASVILKNSGSDRKSDSKKISAKPSYSDSKASSVKLANTSTDRHKLSSGDRHSSTDSRSSSVDKRSSSGSKKSGGHNHSSSHASLKMGSTSSVKNNSKDWSTHSNKGQLSSRSGKEHRFSDSNSQKSSSSGKHTSSIQMKTSSSFHKRERASDTTSDLHRKRSSETLERMNSIFGEDSEEEEGERETTSAGYAPADFQDDSSDSGGAAEEEVDYSAYIKDSDLEEEDTFEECFRIFKEEAPLPKKITGQAEKKLAKDQKKEGSGISSLFARAPQPGKKRIAYKAAEQIRKPELLKKERPRHLISPQEQMHNRIMMMQQRAQERAAMLAVQEQEVSSTSGLATSSRPDGSSSGGVKKRIAHVPKPPPTTSTSSGAKVPKKTTVAITASKTGKRVAHTPNLTNLKRPVIPASFGSKVPSNVRQQYLDRIIEECLKCCSSEEQAFKKALEEEAGAYERSSNKNIYLRVAVNTITRLRTEAKECMPGASTPKQGQWSGRSQSHEATLGGARAAKTNFSLHRPSVLGRKTEVALTEPELYQKLLKYTMSIEQLEENGYPRSCPDTPGKAVILGKSYQDTDTLLKDNERTCSRCGKRFMVNSDGSYVREEECEYHWSRAYPRKKSGFMQHIYNCCSADISSKGCQMAANHVHDRNKKDNLCGFMRTMPGSPRRDGNYGIYALDCEMVYTVGGLELARVTVVNMTGESVFESLVQPFHPIVDYNTRFSGLTAADLKDVDMTLTDVQAILLNLFTDKTILIGHSLESDFIALKLIHSTVVDTSIVFPHRLGPPYKRALKNLMLETFQKIIQADDGGHDSKEDAVACVELMKWRIKEDSKKDRRYSRD